MCISSFPVKALIPEFQLISCKPLKFHEQVSLCDSVILHLFENDVLNHTKFQKFPREAFSAHSEMVWDACTCHVTVKDSGLHITVHLEYVL